MVSKKIVPVRITKVSNSDPDSLAAITPFQDAVAVDNIRELLEQFQQEYKNTVKSISQMLSEMKNAGRADPFICWKIGDLIHNLLRSKAIIRGLALTNYERTLARDLRTSPSRIFYFLRFREMHPTVNDVKPSISWTWYKELTSIRDKGKLKTIEKAIVEGQIRSSTELKAAIKS